MKTARAFILSFFLILAMLFTGQNAFPANHVIVTNVAMDNVRGAIEQGGLVTFACDGVMMLSNTISITNDVCLDASGHEITFNGGNTVRIFQVLPGTTLCLTNIVFASGRSTNGAAIYNEGTVLATRCRFQQNQAMGAAGTNGLNGTNGTSSVAYNPAAVTPGEPGGMGATGGSVAGGALFNLGTAALSQCAFMDNAALAGAGGNGGQGGLGGWTPTTAFPLFGLRGGDGGKGGAGGQSQGGSIANWGVLMASSCAFSNSTAVGGGGGIGGVGGRSPGLNIGIAVIGGGGGPGGLAQGGIIFSSGTLLVSNTVLWRGTANGGLAGPGNQTPISDGCAGTNGGVAWGGALHIAGTGTLVNCTLLTNRALGGAGSIGNWGSIVRDGNGGDAVGGAISCPGQLHGINLTLHDNAARGGLGASNHFVGTNFFDWGTNGNSHGGSIAVTGGVFQIVNSILSGCTSNNAWGSITDLGHNLSSDATPVWTSGTSLNNTDPLLLPLANNGGLTTTMALRADSPALNTADCASAPATDQRGVTRPNGPGCDIGAYEGAGVFALQIWLEGGTTNVVRHAAETGRAYRLQKTVAFDGWIPVTTNTAPPGGWLEFYVPATGSPCFYRVLAQ